MGAAGLGGCSRTARSAVEEPCMRGIGCAFERVFGEDQDDGGEGDDDGDASVEDGDEGEKVCERSVWD